MKRLLERFLQRLTFQRQLGITITLGILLLALLSSVAGSWQSNLRVRNDMIEHGRRLAESLARQSTLAMIFSSAVNAEDAVKNTLAFPEVDGVSIYDADGKQLLATGLEQAPPGNHSGKHKAAELIAEDDKAWLFSAPAFTQHRTEELFGPEWAEPVFLGHVEVLVSKEPMEKLSADIFVSNLTTSFSFALLFLLLIRVLSRNMARPLEELSASMRRARSGESSVRALPGGPKDIAVMAHAFNSMMEVLEEREAALRESERQYRTLVESAMSIILRWDLQGRIIYINPYAEKLFGFRAGELIGRHVVGTIVPETESTSRDLSKMIDGILAAPDNYRLNVNENVRKNGERLWVMWSNRAILDQYGKLIEVLSVGNDITERKRAEDALTESMRQLEEKELAKSRFLAAAGHDLRQPLAAANLFVDALKFTALSEQQDKLIQQLDHSMSTFNGLLDALLNISKLDAGIVKPELRAIPLDEVFSWLEQNFSPLTDEKGLELRLHYPRRQKLAIYSDFGLLKSVLMNLVSNAIKFTPFGSIVVAARRRGSELLFQVWDSGHGIPPDCAPYIFDEFYQVNNPQRDRNRGLGLGLAIVKRSLALLDRKAACRSKEGSGTRFEFTLPLEVSPQPDSMDADRQPLEASADMDFARNRRFIVVDDDMLVAQAMCDLLSGMGGEVSCFHHPEDALNDPGTGNADYYIVDYMLGETTNGIQLLGRIEAQADRPINAVLVTGDTSTDFIREAKQCKWPILHKPVSMSRLISTLSSGPQSAGNQSANNPSAGGFSPAAGAARRA